MPTQDARHAKRRTRRAVYVQDRVASAAVTIGGVGVLATVLAIGVYLVLAVLPLFRGGSVDETRPGATVTEAPAGIVVDDFGRAFVSIDTDGGGVAWLLPSDEEASLISLGEVIPNRAGVRSVSIGTASEPPVAFGYEDGRVQLGRVRTQWRLLADRELTEAAQSMPVGDWASAESLGLGASAAYVERRGEREFRFVQLEAELNDPAPLRTGAGAVVQLDDHVSGAGQRVVAAVRADGSVSISRVRVQRPLGGGAPRVRLRELAMAPDISGATGLAPDDLPNWAFVSADGTAFFAVWRDGRLARAAEIDGAFRLVERIDASRGGVTQAAMLLGGTSLVLGGADGSLQVWFVADDPVSEAPDARRLVLGHDVTKPGGSVRAIGVSPRERVLAVERTDGSVTLRHTTSEKIVASFDTEAAEAAQLAFSSDGATLTRVAGGTVRAFGVDVGHADAGWKALFGSVLYEGQASASFVYQSSAGSDASEAKLSLVPLIWGTLKATVVAMLLAVPIAVLAAIHTSEFMHPRVHRVVKPTLELMAGLPSVVLGFVAAFVVAPFVREWLPSVLVALIVVPVGIAAAASVWQAAPSRVAVRLRGVRVSLAVAALAAVLVFASGPIGHTLERVAFAPGQNEILVYGGSYEPVASPPEWVGQRATMSPDEERRLRRDGLFFRDGGVVRPVQPASDAAYDALRAQVEAAGLADPGFRRWLDGSIGTAMPGWFVALTPVTILLAWFGHARLRGASRGDAMSFARAGVEAGVRVVVTVCVGLLLALALGWILERAGFDPRDSIFGPFSVRNTLVVGFIMGFAVIPIIYTISDDALRSVPAGLRSASLGAGATPWQTVYRVVLPVAGSGIFSACMIGLGRAVGETMIVLMATGNTPEITGNIFGGFRTLAANIAVEMPEAARDSTHYRVLFLCGFVLFVMTFAINTTAEIVRQRFRARNAAL